eukprot:172239-Rhodomonas_salina.1
MIYGLEVRVTSENLSMSSVRVLRGGVYARECVMSERLEPSGSSVVEGRGSRDAGRGDRLRWWKGRETDKKQLVGLPGTIIHRASVPGNA